MFEIFYNKRVVDNLKLIKSNNVVSKKYEELEEQLEINPYCISFSESGIPGDIKIPNSVRKQYHYVELTDDVRILYEICENDSSVEICKIDIEELMCGVGKLNYITGCQDAANTEYAKAIAGDNAKLGRKVLYFSLAQEKEKLNLDDVLVDDTAGISVAEISNRCFGYQQKQGLDMVVIDNVPLIGSSIDVSQTRREECENNVKFLRKLADDLQVELFLVLPLGRYIGINSEPMDYIRQYGDIKQYADEIIMIEKKIKL